MNIHNLPLKLWLSGGMLILLSWIWLTGTMAQADQTLTLPTWQHLSTASGDLPVPSASGQQILALILDVDKDGVNDFVIGARGTPGPSMVWYRRDAAGWTRFVIETDVLQLGSNGAFHDIDSDGDLDVVGGNDSGGNQIWWWENPSPDFTPGIDWTRRIIKNTGAKNHHDMMFGNFDDDPATEFVFWNQGDKKLYLVDVPVDPSATQPWPGAVAIFTSPNNRYEGLAQADVDLDGKIDIIGAGYWFAHAGGASYTANLIEPMIYSRVAAAQFIPGGRPEIVQVSGEADGPARLLTWNGSAWIGSDLPGGPFARAHSLETADVNADGHLDIFIGEMRSLAAGEINPNARALLLLGDGLGGFTTSVVASGFGQHESKLGDLDGDGDIDILGKPFVWMTPRLDIWLNQGVNDSTSTPVLTATPTVSFTETPTTVFTDTPTPVSTTTPTVVPTNTSTPDPGGCPPTLEGNVIANPGFESGVTNWSFFTNAQGEFTTTTQDPFECAQSAQVSITTQGTNVYLSQANLPLQPNSAYQLRVAARSNTGRDVQPLITKQTSPFTNYGLRGVTLDLTPDWQVFTINFTTKGFVSPVLDGWLRFLMSNSNTPGDYTYFDYIALVLAPGVSTPTPTPTATATGTPGTPTTTPTPTVPPIGPVIDLWYGQNQSFGARLGKQSDPQKWVNILGRVSPATGVSLSYRLNGGTSIPLTLGPNNRRLAEAGDFNIELDYTDLLPGANQVLITASSASGTTQVPVTVNYNGGSAWTPGTYSFNWGSAGQINEIAQVVDGQWTIDGSGVRPTILDYDRLVAIGDMSWKDYTVTVPITIFGIDPSGYNPPSGGPGVGFLTRWNGHFDDGGQPPQTGWTRLGALGWYRWEQINGVFTERLRLIGSSNKNIGSNIRQLSFGVTYNFKMQVESSSSPGVAAYYRFKVWPAAEAEPSIWDIQGLGNVSEPTGGSIVLVAHHVDALFGPVTVALTSVRPQPSLTVTTSGSGSGSVSLSPPGPTYRFGQDITLTAAPNGGSVFNGWSGAINGATNPVSIELFENQAINAIFGLSGQ